EGWQWAINPHEDVEATLRAAADHGHPDGDSVRGTYSESRKVLDDLGALGVSYDDVVKVLEDEGVEKFETSWNELLGSVEAELRAKGGGR
ncbi:MAG TPA: transaldolase family protein, partial [Streptosporangiaceae bacterium]